jgi:O-antigen ligase
MLVFEPLLALAVPAAVLGAMIVSDPRARFLLVIGGGLLFLQGSDELTTSKLGYLAIVSLAFIAAATNMLRAGRSGAFHLARPLLTSSFAIFVMIAASFLVAQANGHFVTTWVRDVAPYALFAMAPVFAIDAHTAFSPRLLRIILVLAGSVATISYVVEWSLQRGIVELPVSRVALPSFLLVGALVAFGFAAALGGHKSTGRWLLLTAGILTLLPLTGSRSIVVLVVVPLAIVLAARRGALRRSLRLAAIVPVVVLIVLVAVQGLLLTSNANVEAFSERIEALADAGASDDQSYRERALQFEVSWSAFLSAPLTGVGPGARFDWQGSGDAWLVLDTPLSFLAKFGLIGVGAVLVTAIAYLSFLRRLRRAMGVTVPYLALIGYLALVAGWSVLYVPFEDKGSGLAFGILTAIALADHYRRTDPASTHIES